MKVKCRGYTGNLIYLDANEECIRSFGGKSIIKTTSYEIWIRAADGAKVELRGVSEKEIEVVHTQEAGAV